MSRSQAVQAMHFPKDLAEYKQALRRVKFEELLFFQLQLQVLKEENHDASQGISLAWDPEKLAERKKQLPFELTQAQENSLNEILTDMASPYHMNRLLTRGCGKREDSRGRSCYVCSLKRWEASCLDGSNGDFGRAAQGKLAKSFSRFANCPSNRRIKGG